jgi:hypothetical protein
MNDIEMLRKEGADWVRKQNFWLFGTATFKNGSCICDASATDDAKHFFNILDRKLLTRKELACGQRLPRLVFLEHGRYGANTHIHFFIKGKKPSHLRELLSLAPSIWSSRIANSHDLLLKDNIGVDDTRSEYCWKEISQHNRDVLLIECCHL